MLGVVGNVEIQIAGRKNENVPTVKTNGENFVLQVTFNPNKM